jgi:uncharacterized protein (TIGR02246 family)
MKTILIVALANLLVCTSLIAQTSKISASDNKEIHMLIDRYSEARETRDTVLLNSILTSDIDQLVSSGEWRMGKEGAMNGMMRSSTSNPGERVLTIDKLRLLNAGTALVDARYEIKNTDGSIRKMWSTFLVVKKEGAWRITAIRNMLPAGNP